MKDNSSKFTIDNSLIIDGDYSKSTLKNSITKFMLKAKVAECENYNDLDIAPEERQRAIILNTSKQEKILKKSKKNKDRK